MRVYLKVISALSFLFIANFSSGQKVFESGYIIKFNNDTLWGKIDFRGTHKDYKECTFIDTVENTTKTFLPVELKQYKVLNGPVFISRAVNEKKLFLELFIDGKIDAYLMRDKRGEHYFLERPGAIPLQMIDVRDSEEGYQDGVRVLVESREHINQLKQIFNDCFELHDDIESIGTISKRSLTRLISKYHEICASENSYSVLYKNYSRFNGYIEPVIGLAKFRQSPTLYPTIGLGVHFNVRQISKNIYFKTGAEYTRVNNNIHKFTQHVYIWDLIKVPLQAEYEYTMGKLKPFMALGTDLYVILENFYPYSYEVFELDENEDPVISTINIGSGVRTYTIFRPSISIGARYSISKKMYAGTVYSLNYVPFKKYKMNEEFPQLREKPETFFGAIQYLNVFIGYNF